MTTTSIYRINLLPMSVRQWYLARKLMVVFAVIFLTSIAASLLVFAVINAQTQAATQQALISESAKKRSDAVQAQIQSTLAQVQPLQAKLDFIKKVNDYRERWIALYATLADRTARSGFIYTDASVNGSTMTIKAYSPKVHDVTVYLQAMYQEPDFQSVTVDKVVGFPDNARHLYYLDGHLVFADGAVATPTAAPPAAPVGNLPPGVRPAPPDYTPDSVGPNGANNLPPGVGPPPPQIAVRFLGGFTGSAGGGSAATGGYSPAFLRVAERGMSPFTPPLIREMLLKQALRRIVVRTVPKGFDITVTAALKQPLIPPTPPGMAPPPGPAAGTGTTAPPASTFQDGG